MISFMEACQIAQESLKREGYRDGFNDIRETNESWFFSGRLFEGDIIEYGSVPFSVNKETGDCKAFLIFAPGNFHIFKESVILDIPEQYRM